MNSNHWKFEVTLHERYQSIKDTNLFIKLMSYPISMCCIFYVILDYILCRKSSNHWKFELVLSQDFEIIHQGH